MVLSNYLNQKLRAREDTTHHNAHNDKMAPNPSQWCCICNPELCNFFFSLEVPAELNNDLPIEKVMGIYAMGIGAGLGGRAGMGRDVRWGWQALCD